MVGFSENREFTAWLAPIRSIREDRFASGRTGNAMQLAGSIGAGVLLPTGVALLVVGVLRNKQAKRSAAATLPMLTPTFGRGSAGLSVTGRF